MQYALKNRIISRNPIRDNLAAVSVGIVSGEPRLDLSYAEDSAAEVDMNIVMTGNGKIVEVQGTAETEPFSREMLNTLMSFAEKGIAELVKIQKEIV